MLIYCLLYILLLYYIATVTIRSLHMLQQNLYNENNRYLKWVWKNRKLVYENVDLLGIIFALFMVIINNTVIDNVLVLVLIAVYLLASVNFKKQKSLDQNKKPLVITTRIKRLIATTFIVYFVPIIISIIFNKYSDVLLLITAINISLNFFIVFLAMIINYPIEKCVFLYYKRKAQNKLASMPSLKVVGITGSYGKTSSKNILSDILNVKYNALPTPKSLNTFNGLMLTINNKLSKFDDIFIAEMGAYVRGEIEGLCKLVRPKYGIITSIGTAHLATFGSEENIQKGKMELIESLPSDGVGVLNADDPKQKSYEIKNNCKIIWIGVENKKADVYATNVKCDSNGTKFDVVFKDNKEKYPFETKLLGKHNVYNVLSGIALGKEFGIDVKSLQLGVRKVKPIEHRLELKKIGNFYQIDDAYNSNPVGAKSALDVLEMMDGEKVVVTPGMVELGEKEEELNKIFGNQIAKVANKVILIGEKRTKPIYDGLIEGGYKKEDIYISNDVREAYAILNKMKGKKDLYALFENDLPDTYTEK